MKPATCHANAPSQRNNETATFASNQVTLQKTVLKTQEEEVEEEEQVVMEEEMEDDQVIMVEVEGACLRVRVTPRVIGGPLRLLRAGEVELG